MSGLSRGLDEGWGRCHPPVERLCTEHHRRWIAGRCWRWCRSHHPDHHVEPGKWAEFLADAQAGGQFARSFAPEFDMRRS